MKRVIRVIILLVLMSFVFIRQTSAFFMDDSISSGNTFSAGSLDFVLKNSDDTEITANIVDSVGMIPGDSSGGQFKIVNLGSLNFQYQISPVSTGGSVSLYNNLTIIMKVDSTIVYTGDMSSMALAPLLVLSDGADNVEVEIGLSANAPESVQLTSCTFDLVVRGTQLGVTGGFWDEELISGSASTSDWTEPIISGLMLASPSDPNGIKVNWKTDENSTSLVEVGTTPVYGSTFPMMGDMTADNTSHTVILSGLTLNTTYHLRVVSTDGYGNTAYSEDYEFILRHDWYEFVPRGAIVINEIFANPIGDDNVAAPYGEWIELYNNGTSSIDVAGWSICTTNYCVNINSSITDTGFTTIAPGGFLVVNFGGYEFLGNSGWEVVALYRPGILGLRDLHWYYGTQEGKSIVRYPDGSNNWYDPIPSPGLPNNIDPIILNEPKKEEEFLLPNFVEVDKPIVEEVILDETKNE